MRSLSNDLLADAEIQALRQQYTDIGEIPPPFHFDCYRNFEVYKAEMREELAELRKQKKAD